MYTHGSSRYRLLADLQSDQQFYMNKERRFRKTVEIQSVHTPTSLRFRLPHTAHTMLRNIRMVGEWPVIMWYMRAMRDQSTPTALADELIDKVPGQMVPLLQDLYNAKDTSVIPFYATTQQGCYLPSVTEHYFEVLARGCNLPSMASLRVDVYNVTITTQEDVLRLYCLNNLKAVWPQMDLSRDLKGHVLDYLKELVEMDTAVHSYKFFTCCCSAVTTELRSNSLAV
jgi:hypothetical protein